MKAVEEIGVQISAMLAKMINANIITLNAFVANDQQAFDEVLGHLKSVQHDADRIDRSIIAAFLQCESDSEELELLIACMKSTNELVRIAEGTKKYARRMKEHEEHVCSLAPVESVVVSLHKSAISSLRHLHAYFEDVTNGDIDEVYRQVMIEESKNDDIFAVLEKDILGRIELNSACAFEYVRILGTMRRLERICDRAVNVVNLLIDARPVATLDERGM